MNKESIDHLEALLTEAELAELERMDRAAFRAPWTYESWEIDCPEIYGGDECGYEHNIATVIAPDEYPNDPNRPQVVAQIDVPGIDVLAHRNGALIAAARNALPRLLAELRRLRADVAGKPRWWSSDSCRCRVYDNRLELCAAHAEGEVRAKVVKYLRAKAVSAIPDMCPADAREMEDTLLVQATIDEIADAIERRDDERREGET